MPKFPLIKCDSDLSHLLKVKHDEKEGLSHMPTDAKNRTLEKNELQIALINKTASTKYEIEP